jgi:hypothetical protein
MKLMSLSLVSATVAVMSSVSCTTPTTITDVWRDPGYTAGPMKKILVHGAGMGDTTRRTFEDRCTAALANRGVHAMQAYRVYPNQVPDREEVRRYVSNEGYDGALVANFKGTETRLTVTPSSDFYTYYGRWDSAYVSTDRYVKAETSLWDVKTAKLVWSATTETENPSSNADAVDSIVDKMMSSMTDANLIPRGPAVARVVFQSVH